MNANPNTNEEITQQREHQAWELRLRCWSQVQIAEHLGITQGAVSQILKRVRTRLAEEFAAGAAEMRVEQTEQLIRIAMKALDAWEQSQQETASIPRNQTTPESEIGERTAPPPTQETPEEAPAQPNALPAEAPAPRKKTTNVAYLRTAIQALASIRSIWGLNLPFKEEIKNDPGAIKMLIGVDYHRMFSEKGVHVPKEEVERLCGPEEEVRNQYRGTQF